jgi:alkylated DNA repair dioxygenase AlkB
MIAKELDLETLPESQKLNIPGLTYIPNYINAQEQNQLLHFVDQQPWAIDSAELTRRIQQHGYKLIYQNGVLVASCYLGALPDWLGKIASKLVADSLTPTVPEQVTINEYLPGQGIRSHIDCDTCFGNTVMTLSVGSSCVMQFTHVHTKEKAEILLLPGSLLILKGAARYHWLHGVAPRQADVYKGEEFVRTRRVSLAFREVLFPHK